ncbi:MAG: nucleotidyl transferase AbiEii/AbiGii toxin family protein [Azoarcus sp.]|jgi:hypothetical protein|nr:nucleotidyl transferase AbiEii/AbiGii toxin family protein [Azoarcus sp.]
MSPNLAASVRARLLNVAKAQESDFNQVLVRFALERILYRLTQSKYADRFLLKGALLFTLWYDMPHRAMCDADLLGMMNSRVKDYFDLSVLLERETLDARLLAQAIKATFERRGMTVPTEPPVGLTDEFVHDVSRQALWQSFVKKNDLDPEPLAAIVGRLRLALEPALNRAAR